MIPELGLDVSKRRIQIRCLKFASDLQERLQRLRRFTVQMVNYSTRDRFGIRPVTVRGLSPNVCIMLMRVPKTVS